MHGIGQGQLSQGSPVLAAWGWRAQLLITSMLPLTALLSEQEGHCSTCSRMTGRTSEQMQAIEMTKTLGGAVRGKTFSCHRPFLLFCEHHSVRALQDGGQSHLQQDDSQHV